MASDNSTHASPAYDSACVRSQMSRARPHYPLAVARERQAHWPGAREGPLSIPGSQPSGTGRAMLTLAYSRATPATRPGSPPARDSTAMLTSTSVGPAAYQSSSPPATASGSDLAVATMMAYWVSPVHSPGLEPVPAADHLRAPVAPLAGLVPDAQRVPGGLAQQHALNPVAPIAHAGPRSLYIKRRKAANCGARKRLSLI